ncbi:metallophosphoesterase [Spongiimicrobium salis]|uniref:metallophosphoesterase n=1 Tax=Spongiimicrobium salis TaxID=1667022 RepID=UPI00374DB414
MTKYVDGIKPNDASRTKTVSHTFYLIGDAGLSPSGELNPALQSFKERLERADKNSTAIFLGDNIYPAGLPSKKNDLERSIAQNNLNAQLKTLDNFKGKTIFIPGNHDWYSDGLKGVERQQKYIEDKLNSKEVFFPQNGCPLQKVEINETTVVIAIDTEWYLTNWNKHPNMNDECDIKDREKFFEELEGLIKKNADKTTILALHHPMFTYGEHGGQFSLKQQLYPGHNKIPLPVLGTVINVLRRTTGASTTDVNNARYRELKKRIVTLAQYSEKVIFASGHEHNLQYIVENNTPQILSGSGAKKGATRLLNGSKFSSGKLGYATLEVYEDGSSRVRFFGVDEVQGEEFLYTAEVLPADVEEQVGQYATDFPATQKASVYTQEEITKSGFFKTVWGERYRKYYGTEITAPTVRLDTLFGGLKPIRKGGGHQSKSLRLEDSEGRQYVMRALRKSAELYLQAIAFKDQYVIGEFQDTYTERLLLDFYTGAHPYAPFTVSELSDAVNIYHTNPQLFYVPKQAALGGFNENFGDELYLLEERTSDGHGNQKSFGYANKMESTDDLLKKLRKDEKYAVDTEMYIRARLFDMIIGDWDRHADQWRWAEFKDKDTGKVVYRPIPRDRDQTFSKLGDGALMGLATKIVPSLRLFEGFREEIRSVKGFTSPFAFALDTRLLGETTLEQWQEQEAFIRKNLSEDVIDKAFEAFPVEVRDGSIDEMKRILLARINDLPRVSKEYHDILNKYVVITGTDKDDWFQINCLNANEVEVLGYRNMKGKKDRMFFQKKFHRKTTKEIWIYGLDDDDYFEVTGVGRSAVKIRLIGGQNNDIYDTKGIKNIYGYDQKAKKNTVTSPMAHMRLSNNYDLNTYQPLRLKRSVNQLVPLIGFNPDDGLNIGLTDTYTHNGFLQNPFTSQHTFNAAFYFATSGFDFGYTGEFAQVFGNANLALSGRFTSPNFSRNFFGFGNETVNVDDDLGLNFNRVRLQTIRLSPSLVWRGQLGSKFRTGISYETIEVEETEDRFINTFFLANGTENSKSFVGVDAEYSYENRDNDAFPTLGMATSLHVGYTVGTESGAQGFGYIIPSFSLDYRLVPDGRLVVASKWKAHFNVGDGFEFYQGASIGGVNGLRGFRNERFTGKKSYYQNTDLRYSLQKIRTGIVPVALGIYGGFDYGRVWLPEEDSGVWHTSYGGGFFVNGTDLVSISAALFSSDDGLRFTFGLGFGF